MAIIIFVLILIILLLSFRNTRNTRSIDKYQNFSKFNKLVSYPNQDGSVLQYIKVEPNQINQVINLGGYFFMVKLVEINIPKSKYRTILSSYNNTKKIKVYIQYNNTIGMVELIGKVNDYKNLHTSHIKLDTISHKHYDVSHFLTIKQIYINDVTEDWHGLILVLNEFVENNTRKIPLIKDVHAQPIITNLLNPVEDIVHNNNNYHAYRTPYRSNIDLYGAVNKESKDNTRRTIDEIRKRIAIDNNNSKLYRYSQLKNGESKTIIDVI